MLKSLFGKKMPSYDAANLLLQFLLRSIQDDWKDDKEILSDILYFEHDHEEMIQFELFLASIAMELFAIKNISPDKYNLIYSHIISILGTIEKFGPHAVKTIQVNYFNAVMKARITSTLEHEGILIELAERLNVSPNPLNGTILLSILATKGAMWKTICDKYKIT